MLSSFIAVDTETTGLDFENDRIIELAAVRFEHGVPIDTFTALLSPGDRALSPVARLITGITDEELASAPPRADTLHAFLAFAGSLPLVAHNAEFDAHFVKRALEAEGLPPLPGVWIDTLLLTRIAWPEWDSHRLDSLAERLSVPRDDEHRALPDARRAGYVCIAAQHHLRHTLSPAGREALARLAATLPDWSLVFPEPGTGEYPDVLPENRSTGAGGEGAGTLHGDTAPVGAAQPLGAVSSPAPGDEREQAIAEITMRLAALCADEEWLALETPASLDDLEAGFVAAVAHLEGAGTGARLLFAVPDTHAWNILRKRPLTGSRPLKIVALAEPSGYVCRARLAALLEEPTELSPEERAVLMPLVAWIDRAGTTPGPVADGRGFSPDRARVTWSRVQCDTWQDDESARAARNAAAAADLIIVTHATLCAHVRSGGALLPACDAVIVTGAHRYPDAALSPAGTGRMLSLFRLRETLALLHPPSTGAAAGATAETAEAPAAGSANGEISDGLGHAVTTRLATLGEPLETEHAAVLADWFAADRELQKFLQKAGKHAAKAGGNDYRIRYLDAAALGADSAPVRDALRAREAALTAVADRLTHDMARAGALRRIAARLRAVRLDFEFLTNADDVDTVYWIEDGGNPHRATLRSAPRALEPFGESLRTLFGAGLFLSPVLVTGGDPMRDARPFLRQAGLQASPDTGAPAVAVRRLKGAHAPRYVMVPFAPAPAANTAPGDLMETYARFLIEAAGDNAARHGVLVFCPSQTAVRTLHGALRKVIAADAANAPGAEPVRLLAQWIDGNREAIARLYAAGRGGFVIASEGLPGLRDAGGGAPALWMLTRMPLPPPRDPLLDARSEPLREEGLNARLELWHPAAVARLKRDFALMRKNIAVEAPGSLPARTIVLLDARAATEGLGGRLADALAAKPETARNMDELKAKLAEAGH